MSRLSRGNCSFCRKFHLMDWQYVITEYGVAYLFGKSLQERAKALIQIAHPAFREELAHRVNE
jgi:acyl-CoA hydrolase